MSLKSRSWLIRNGRKLVALPARTCNSGWMRKPSFAVLPRRLSPHQPLIFSRRRPNLPPLPNLPLPNRFRSSQSHLNKNRIASDIVSSEKGNYSVERINGAGSSPVFPASAAFQQCRVRPLLGLSARRLRQPVFQCPTVLRSRNLFPYPPHELVRATLRNNAIENRNQGEQEKT